jgi:hypothetical protein
VCREYNVSIAYILETAAKKMPANSLRWQEKAHRLSRLPAPDGNGRSDGFNKTFYLLARASQIAEKLTPCHSEGRGLPEESAFSCNWRRKADPSLRSG